MKEKSINMIMMNSKMNYSFKECKKLKTLSI